MHVSLCLCSSPPATYKTDTELNDSPDSGQPRLKLYQTVWINYSGEYI